MEMSFFNSKKLKDMRKDLSHIMKSLLCFMIACMLFLPSQAETFKYTLQVNDSLPRYGLAMEFDLNAEDIIVDECSLLEFNGMTYNAVAPGECYIPVKSESSPFSEIELIVEERIIDPIISTMEVVTNETVDVESLVFDSKAEVFDVQDPDGIVIWNKTYFKTTGEGNAVVYGYTGEGYHVLTLYISSKEMIVGKPTELSTYNVEMKVDELFEIKVYTSLYCDCAPEITDAKLNYAAPYTYDYEKYAPAEIVSFEGSVITIKGLLKGNAELVISGVVAGIEFEETAKITVDGGAVQSQVTLSEYEVFIEEGESHMIFALDSSGCKSCKPQITNAYFEYDMVYVRAPVEIVEFNENVVEIKGITACTATLIIEGEYNGETFVEKVFVMVNQPHVGDVVDLTPDFVELMPGDEFYFDIIPLIECVCPIENVTAYFDYYEYAVGNAEIIDVSNKGVIVQAVNSGKARLVVTGTINGIEFKEYADIYIHEKPHPVKDTLYFDLNPSELTIKVGEEAIFELPEDYVWLFDDRYNDIMTFLPWKTNTWKSNNEKIATVSDEVVTGVVTGINLGVAEITFTTENSEMVSIAKGIVNVVNDMGLIHTATIPVGHKIAIDKAFPALPNDCTFQLSTQGIISIDRSFNIYGISHGTVDIEAYSVWGELLAVCRVYVEQYDFIDYQYVVERVELVEYDQIEIEFEELIDIDVDLLIEELDLFMQLKTTAPDIKNAYISDDKTTLVLELDRKLEEDETLEVSFGSVEDADREPAVFTVHAKGLQNTALATDQASVSLDVFPNPAVNYCSVDADGDVAKITITDMSGKTMKVVAGTDCQQPINLNDVVTGNYIVKVTLENGDVAVKQLIKK